MTRRARPAPPRARKRFGQNFLTDAAVIDRIAAAIDPRPGDHLVEIGPGRGALTEALLPSGCRLDAIELDRDLSTPLLAAFSIYPGFRLHRADALDFDYATLLAPVAPRAAGVADAPAAPWRAAGDALRVVGNLPYNISTPLIFRLLDFAPLIRDMHFMLQLEVVERLTAGPGSGHWGRLGIMVQYQCDTELLFEVPPQAFEPRPKVQSAIVRLQPLPRPRWPDVPRAALAQVVQAAFAQRRKTLRNNLRGLFDARALEALGIDPGARAKTLALSQFIALARAHGDAQRRSGSDGGAGDPAPRARR